MAGKRAQRVNAGLLRSRAADFIARQGEITGSAIGGALDPLIQAFQEKRARKEREDVRATQASQFKEQMDLREKEFNLSKEMREGDLSLRKENFELNKANTEADNARADEDLRYKKGKSILEGAENAALAAQEFARLEILKAAIQKNLGTPSVKNNPQVAQGFFGKLDEIDKMQKRLGPIAQAVGQVKAAASLPPEVLEGRVLARKAALQKHRLQKKSVDELRKSRNAGHLATAAAYDDEEKQLIELQAASEAALAFSRAAKEKSGKTQAMNNALAVSAEMLAKSQGVSVSKLPKSDLSQLEGLSKVLKPKDVIEWTRNKVAPESKKTLTPDPEGADNLIDAFPDVKGVPELADEVRRGTVSMSSAWNHARQLDKDALQEVRSERDARTDAEKTTAQMQEDALRDVVEEVESQRNTFHSAAVAKNLAAGKGSTLVDLNESDFRADLSGFDEKRLLLASRQTGNKKLKRDIALAIAVKRKVDLSDAKALRAILREVGIQ